MCFFFLILFFFKFLNCLKISSVLSCPEPQEKFLLNWKVSLKGSRTKTVNMYLSKPQWVHSLCNLPERQSGLSYYVNCSSYGG